MAGRVEGGYWRFSIICLYKSSTFLATSGVEPDVTFGIFFRVRSWEPPITLTQTQDYVHNTFPLSNTNNTNKHPYLF